ncbi:MAG TPA: HNH endonuclease signature motif containing protein, partial [Acidimicrobiales bacterium]|nr:HNH endonuclease signature motif containing protein [Acidimicrobiales bacterium]
VFDGSDRILGVGKRRRFFTGAERRAVEVRDRECTNRWCEEPAERCEVDHVIPWALGGSTEVDNGQLACGYHNRLRERAPP